MSVIEIASAAKFSYQRLRNEGGFDEGDEGEGRVIVRTRSRSKLRKAFFKKRPKIRIPGLRRFLRRKTRLLARFRLIYGRIMKRLKENESHLGDLFAGNYFFAQINPTPLKCVGKDFVGHRLHEMSSTYSAW